ncbi:uncharacterized protein LOC133404720 [Phycodurus eques]|uniref:uncharacterized protein LOC133404720 n=1 Tax=Phycodurus eques TaxID=693459 RepID=UPI002ACD738A|nr:uncharacterized protein LOC133404720 [Phycodurus eques]
MARELRVPFTYDIHIFSRSPEEHRQHVRQVLHAYLKTASLLNLTNVNSTSPLYTSWDISSPKDNYNQMRLKSKQSLTGPFPPPAKNCNVSWALPTSTADSAGITVKWPVPLTSLTSTSSQLQWTSAASQAFEHLKELFTSAPILRHPDHSLQFVMEVEASDTGAGASLSSGYHPQSNGQKERANQNLESALRCVPAHNSASSSTFLPWLEYGHNSLTSSPTDMSPFMSSYGCQPPLFKEQEHVVAVPVVREHL